MSAQEDSLIRCPRCGAEFKPGTPAGVCPACAFADALSGPAADGTASAPTPEGAPVPAGQGGAPGKPDKTIALSSPPTEKPGDRIGRYKLLEQLGEGGCGVVYVAEQEQPVRRRVALKVIKLGMDTRQVIARFEAERQALALMDHPNIAKVLDGGATETGRPFFVMELVRGLRITDYCDRNKLSTKERLGLFVQVCQAIQHAHQKGIIHRDIKPSNILVTLHDGVPVPKVIDFGIAKATTDQRLTDKTVYTAIEQFIGTAAYMSPEQAELSGLDIDTRSDIYALGVLLYELLTGKMPFDAQRLVEAGLDEIRRIIREEDPPRPSTRIGTLGAAEPTAIATHRHSEPPKLQGIIRGDLDWIVMMCLEKDRRRRYESANGLVMDIQRHLNDEPVVARPPSMLYRFEKTVKRNKLAFGAATTLAVVLVLAVLGFAGQALRATRAERIAKTERGKAEEGRERETGLRALAEQRGQEVRRNLYFAQMNLAGQTADLLGGLEQTAELLSTWRYGKPDLRGWEWYYLNGLCHSELMTIRGGLSPVAWSPDASKLASASQGGAIKIFSAANGNEILTLRGHSNRVNSVAWSPDSLRLASAGGDKAIRIWDATGGGELLMLLKHTGAVRVCAWSPNGQWLASASEDQTVRIWDATNGNELHSRPRDVSSLAWSPDSTRLALVTLPVVPDSSGPISVLDVATGNEAPLPGMIPEGVMRSVAWSPDGQRLAYAGTSFTTYISDATTGRRLGVLQGHSYGVWSVAWSPDGARLASASADRTVRVWDVAASRQLALLRGHAGPIKAVTWSPDGTRLASASSDGMVKVWGTTNGVGSVSSLRHPGQQAISLGWSPGGNRIASGDNEGNVRIWDTSNGQELLLFRGHTSFVWSVAWCPDDRRLASSDITGSVKVWEAATGKETCRLATHGSESRSVAWSPDGRRLVSAHHDKTARVWDAATGQELVTFRGHASALSTVSWEPGGTRVASGGEDALRIWDAATGREILAILHPHSSWVRHLSWNPNGTRLVSTSDDGLVKIWDAATGKGILTLRGHSGQVYSAEWSLDGTRIATASQDKAVKIWDAVTGEEVASFANSGGFVNKVAWGGPDGTRIASASFNGTVMIRDAMPGYAIERSARALPWSDRSRVIDPQNPQGLQLRAEIRAGQGKWDDAAADIRQYLGLPQNRASRWYQAGWWVVGPYPESLKETYGPESNPDPSAPVNAAFSQAEPKPAQLSWQPLPLEANPQVDLQAVLGNVQHTSIYAFQGVYSSEQQMVAILVDSNDPLRLWLNGKLLHEREDMRQEAGGLDVVPAVLQAGWNKLLVRVSHGTGALALSLRLSEQPPAPNTSVPKPERP